MRRIPTNKTASHLSSTHVNKMTLLSSKNLLDLITSQGIKLNTRLISHALLEMGLRAERKRKHLEDSQSWCYFGVKLRSLVGPRYSFYEAERDYAPFFNTEAMNMHCDPYEDPYRD